MQSAIADDGALIDALGGPTRVAERLGYDKAKGGVQRVQNWKTRGIPWRVKAERPDLFLPARNEAAEGAAGSTGGA